MNCDMHTIRIDKNDSDPVIPNWVYTAEPVEVIRQLISDGAPHMAKEAYVIIGFEQNLIELVELADGHVFILNNELWFGKKELSMFESNFGFCVNTLLDMYNIRDTWSYSDIENRLGSNFPKESTTLAAIISRARLILFLRNTLICLRTTFSKDPKIDDGGERISYGEGKAIREPSTGKGRFDLITPFGLERLAKWYEFGAKKYSDRNWEKGLPFSRYFDSAMRHMTKFIMGRTDEDHLAAAVWNLMAIMHHQELCEIELDDLPHYISRRGCPE